MRKRARRSDETDITAVESDVDEEEGRDLLVKEVSKSVKVRNRKSRRRKDLPNNDKAVASNARDIEDEAEAALVAKESAQERANRSIDIWSLIFEWLVFDEATLAHCACVCKSWWLPSMSILWRYLPSLVPLLQLLGPMNFDPEDEV